ncbi:TonB-dependent receptor domain-containing protein [Novosphingobium sp. JCM 18896]|uniref:TonB-dependent receptor domain-containing protein n=1 Tax=Novosphingobium sp. JCM 18896 TaxID=2989731 RepID=UPI002222BA97|nr:TonB-dependent receptor [Novosphingobium sp. JCM 18896]MCW1429495.1 TonB-dependent receptor [Novosphingobium sp. JCM 18896]
MINSTLRAFRALSFAGVAALAIVPGLAAAQESTADAPGGEGGDGKEIVVTGTLIRGAPPVGANVISIGQESLQSTAATSSNELLASIPQVTNYFNRVPVSDLSIAVNQIQISRPNIRNISPNNASSSATLILVDGHRVASAGVNQASVDPDLIPTGAIERVEVVTEGGSSIYGADAVAGVINFITRKRFDGLEVSGRYGLADDYWQWDASATLGKAWETGSIYASYTFTKNDALYGRDRDYIRNVNYASQPYLPRDLTCDSPNLAVNTVLTNLGATISSVNYAGPRYAANTFNRCDNSDDNTFVPRAERHGAIVGFTQEFGDRLTLDARAFYSQRTTLSTSVLDGVVTVGSGNPYNAANLPAGLFLGPLGSIPIPGLGSQPIDNRATVSFGLGPVYGLDSQRSSTSIKEGGVNAELKFNVNEDWQIRGLLNWSQSDSRYELTQLSPTRLAAAGLATTTATAINPYNVALTSRALLDDIADSSIAGQAKDSLFNARLIAEGRLFTIGGGDVRLAAGYEFMHDTFKQRFSNDVRLGGLINLPFTPYKRDVHSLFGELQVPIIGEGNRTGGLYSFTISASGRYDHYSDFGDTFNPKIGATLKPVEWLAIRGNWGTSFTAPTPLDQLGSLRNSISSFPFVAFTKPGDTPTGGSFTIALQGSQPGLKPQKADTWSVGVDLTPLPSLRASVSYYDVKFKDILRTPTANVGIFTDFPNNVTTSVSGLTAAQLRAIGALAPGGSAVVEPLIASGTPVYEFVDFRTGNFGIVHVKGIDFSVNYRHETGFGALFADVSGNRPLSRKAQVSPTSVVVDELARDNPKLFLQTSIGADVGGFRAQATWNHNGGYAIVPTTGTPVQNRVSAFNTVNLFFKYDVPSDSGMLKDLSFTLNVNNVFDQDPPILRRNDQNEFGYANGFTIGRMFILGVSKKF